MTETTIDEVLSLLRDKKIGIDDMIHDNQRKIEGLEQRQRFLEERLTDVKSMIVYIEEDDHITDAAMKTIMDDTCGIRGTDYHRYRDGRDALPS